MMSLEEAGDGKSHSEEGSFEGRHAEISCEPVELEVI